MEFYYGIYDHEPFNHLQFEVLDEWIIEQHGLETVFLNVDDSLPQLHFQTVGNTEKYDSAHTFYDFLLQENWPGEILEKTISKCSGYDAIQYEYIANDSPEIYVYGLIIAVGEGILWFYLKVPSNNPEPYRAIRDNLCRTLDFK